jgi:Zn-dependent peptidase ImmA (M78 family)
LIDDLFDFAKRNGVNVKYGDLGRRRGEYRHSHNLIVINPRMSEVLQRSTLAHELGHWHHADEWTDDPRTLAARERRANEYAARMLISPVDYALAERAHGPHVGAIARELEVATYVVEAWQGILGRAVAAPAPVRRYLRAV